MTKEEFFNKIRKMSISELAKKIDDTDSITATFVMLKKYIQRKIEYSEMLIANDMIEDIDFEELAISLMEDLQRCFQMLVILGDLSIKKKTTTCKGYKYVRIINLRKGSK